MRILYVGMKYDYGKPEQGYSFEHNNLFDSLRRMGHDIVYFDFMSLLQAHGREAMNRRLLEVARAEQADALFSILFHVEFDFATIRTISEEMDTVTINWFCDDHWRFENFTAGWAPCFNWAVTTARSALPKYAALGCEHVIKSQWACNPFQYRKLELPLTHDVTFVGQPHGDRREIIDAVRRAGIRVQAWGSGWEAGRVSQEEMIRIFNQSRINLNLTNASTQGGIANFSAPGWVLRSVNMLPFSRTIKNAGKRTLRALRRMSADPATALSTEEQIKGRNFEVPGCGGFLLTGPADDLDSYYKSGEEIVCFGDTGEMIEKIRYYLVHEEERAAVAEAGYRRTLTEHTYVHRFEEIFRQAGLPHAPAETVLNGRPRSGAVEEVA